MKKFIVIFYVFFSINLFSQTYFYKNDFVKIKITVPKNALIGDVFKYKLELKYSQNILLDNFSPLKSLQNFDVKSIDEYSPKILNLFSKNIIKVYLYNLSSYEKGKIIILPININYTLNKNSYSLRIKGNSVDILGVMDPKQKNFLKDIKPNLKLYNSIMNILFVISLLLFFILIYKYLIFYSFKEENMQKNILSPSEVALQKLNLIYGQSISTKIFYIKITEILKEYLENRFLLDILDKTSYEIYLGLKNVEIDRSKILGIKSFLEDADLVKFAKYIPNDDLKDQHINFVKSFILETKED